MNWQAAFIVSIVTLIFTFLGLFVKLMFKHLKKPKNRNFNLFGKQTINEQKESPQEHIIKGVDKTNERLDRGALKFDELYKHVDNLYKKLDDLNDKLDLLILAFGIYVQNNGAKSETKKAVRQILENVTKKRSN